MNQSLLEYLFFRVLFLFVVPVTFWLCFFEYNASSFMAIKSALEYGIVVPLINVALVATFVILGGILLFLPERKKGIELSFMAVIFVYCNMFIVLSIST